MRASTAKRRGLAKDPVAVAQSQTLIAFQAQLRRELKPVLGDAGLRRVRNDLAICTSVGGGVIVQAPLKLPKGFNARRLDRKGEIAAVLGTTIPLTDPVTETALEPGVYAWGVRKVGEELFAFDFFNKRGAPALSTMARQKDDHGPVRILFGGLDIDISYGGPDSFYPPGYVVICVSMLHWRYCYYVEM